MKKSYFLLIFLICFLGEITFAQTGIVKSYYYGGGIREAISYSGGVYDGTSYWYYPNGNLKEVKTFSNGKLNGWVRSYYESGLLAEEKYVNNGVVDGIAKSYYANGALRWIRNYENGFLVKSTDFEYDPYYQAPIQAYQAGNLQQETKKKDTEEFLCDVKICPEPLGGMSSIYEKLVYPYDARAYGLEGEVRLIAKVNAEGKVIETKVIKGIGLGCDEAVIEAVTATRFLPGQNESGPTTANVTLSVEFQLETDELTAQNKKRTIPSTESVDAPEIGIESKPKRTTVDVSSEPKVVQEVQPQEVTLDEKSNENAVRYQNEKPVKQISDEENFTCSDVDVCAKPKGGIAAVLKNLKIPNRVRETNTKGVVKVLCEVDENGKVRKTIVQKGLPHGAGIAVEVALLDTNFEPALKNGKPVQSKVSVIVPVDY